MNKHEKVSIKLTDEQKRLIRESSGRSVDELWVSFNGETATGHPRGMASEMEEGGRVEQRERREVSNPARSGR